MNKSLSIIAVILSIFAVSIALWRHIDYERKVDEALRAREAALIRHFTPNLQRIAADFDLEYPKDPQTIEEAFDPILQMIESVSGR